MSITALIAQLRTTDLAASIRFHTEKLGFSVAFVHGDFYAGINAGSQVFHLKQVDEKDPTIAYVAEGDHFHLYIQTDDAAALAQRLQSNGVVLARELHETPWGTLEFVVYDDQGHTLYFGQPR